MKKIFLALIIIIIILAAGLGTCIIIKISHKPPVAIASANITFGQAPLKIYFNASGFDPDNGKINFYHWDFGDGNTSITKNPTHTYYSQGKFYACLTITNDEGEKAKDTIQINIIDYQKPISIASANITCGKAPLKISFIGSSYNTNNIIEAYEWDFGDGSTDNNQNTTHIYKKPGRYSVNLKVINNDGIIGLDTIEINVLENYKPTAHASADLTEGKAPLKVNFIGSGEDIDGKLLTYHWVFEDTIIETNRASNNKNTTHIFWFPGNYLVTLTVEDNDGAKDTDKILINVNVSFFSRALDRFFEMFKEAIIQKIIDLIL